MILSLTIVTKINNESLFETVQDIASEYSLKGVEQAANVAYHNIYFENLRKGIRKIITVPDIKARMIKNGIKEEELNLYDITINNGDVYISRKSN